MLITISEAMSLAKGTKVLIDVDKLRDYQVLEGQLTNVKSKFFRELKRSDALQHTVNELEEDNKALQEQVKALFSKNSETKELLKEAERRISFLIQKTKHRGDILYEII